MTRESSSIPVGHSPNGSSSQIWARPKAGAACKSPAWVERAPSIRARATLPSQVHQQGIPWAQDHWDLNQSSDVGISRGILTHCTTTLSPEFYI